MKSLLTILLICSLTGIAFAESSTEMGSEPIIITPPEEITHLMILDSGEVVIYFNEMEWLELSRLLWEDRTTTAEEAVKEAVVPLLAQLEVLKRGAVATRVYKWGMVVGVGAALAATIVAVLK